MELGTTPSTLGTLGSRSKLPCQFEPPVSPPRPLPQVPARVNCSAIFVPPSLALLGAGSGCTWAGPTHVLVVLSPNATVQPGDRLRLSPDTVQPADAAQFYDGFEGTVALPGPVPPPAARLLAPASVGPCAGVVLDAYASQVATRARHLNWEYVPWAGPDLPTNATATATAAPSPAPLPALQRFLQGQGGQDLVAIPADLLPEGPHTFRVVVADYFGTAAAAEQTVYKSAEPAPRLWMGAPSPIATRWYLTTALQAVAHPSACGAFDGAPTPGRLGYIWEATSHPGLLRGLPRAGAELVLPPFWLQPGDTYTFRVTVTDLVDGRHSSDVAEVVVDRSALQMHVAGSTQRRMGPVGALVLDASPSYDPDAPAPAPAPQYQWGACYEDRDRLVAPERGGLCAPEPLDAAPAGLLPAALSTPSAAQPRLELQGTPAVPFPLG